MGWIDISERQPEKNVRVLIFEDGYMHVSYWNGTYSQISKWLQFPDEQDEQPGFYWPTHWMPLPEPPTTTQ
jgi:hypothetical protein